MHLELSQNLSLLGLAVSLFLLYLFSGNIRLQMRFGVLKFIHPTALLLCSLLVVIDIILAIFVQRYIVALASVPFVMLTFPEVFEKLATAKEAYKIRQRNTRYNRASRLTRIWDALVSWRHTRLEKNEERKLQRQIRIEKARILAERELAIDKHTSSMVDES